GGGAENAAPASAGRVRSRQRPARPRQLHPGPDSRARDPAVPCSLPMFRKKGDGPEDGFVFQGGGAGGLLVPTACKLQGCRSAQQDQPWSEAHVGLEAMPRLTVVG